jgi:hypothetical protein
MDGKGDEIARRVSRNEDLRTYVKGSEDVPKAKGDDASTRSLPIAFPTAQLTKFMATTTDFFV